MRFIITEINFDTDNNSELNDFLKEKRIGTCFEFNSYFDATMYAADAISDEDGYCVESLKFKEVL